MHLFNSLCNEMEVCIKHFCVYEKTRIVLSETTCRFVQATSERATFHGILFLLERTPVLQTWAFGRHFLENKQRLSFCVYVYEHII